MTFTLPIKVTESLFRQLTDDSQGVCLKCGQTRDCCEPDAAKYPCENCGKRAVYGIEMALICGQVLIVDTEDECNVIW